MTKILPSAEAEKLCREMITELDNNRLGNLLLSAGSGRMFGILVCTDGTVLKAFSGELLGSYLSDGFVPPVFDVKELTDVCKPYEAEVKRLTAHICEGNFSEKETELMRRERRALTRECWKKLKDIYRFHCFDGKIRTLNEVYPNAQAGTGDCCAPRLLSYCYSIGKKPASMAEFFYGNGTLEHKKFYTPCDERCKPVLPAITGLDIVYLDDYICVVNKPSGLLAIEGRGSDKQDCVASRLRNLISYCIKQPCVHRLDQSTSGLMVLGLTQKAHDALSADFENRKVHKEYVALVDGKVMGQSGTIDIPIRLDTEHRPVQIPDPVNGKRAVTEWERICICRYGNRDVTKLKLVPLTGRTHQLRVHCAQALFPICNDAIYGKATDRTSLCLTASRLCFTHPVTGKKMDFTIPES